MYATNITTNGQGKNLENNLMKCDYCPGEIDLDIGFETEFEPKIDKNGKVHVEWKNQCHMCKKEKISNDECETIDYEDDIDFNNFLRDL